MSPTSAPTSSPSTDPCLQYGCSRDCVEIWTPEPTPAPLDSGSGSGSGSGNLQPRRGRRGDSAAVQSNGNRGGSGGSGSDVNSADLSAADTPLPASFLSTMASWIKANLLGTSLSSESAPDSVELRSAEAVHARSLTRRSAAVGMGHRSAIGDLTHRRQVPHSGVTRIRRADGALQQDPGSDSGSGSGLTVTMVERQCGWDHRLGLCRTGRRTDVNESELLLEAKPGDCAHHTVNPTPAPSPPPTPAPATTTTPSLTDQGMSRRAYDATLALNKGSPALDIRIGRPPLTGRPPLKKMEGSDSP